MPPRALDINIKLTQAEALEVNAQAAQLGMSRANFIRFCVNETIGSTLKFRSRGGKANGSKPKQSHYPHLRNE